MSDVTPFVLPHVPQAEADRSRFAIQHVLHCPECTTTGWCDTYRAMLTEIFGADLAAWLLDGEEGEV